MGRRLALMGILTAFLLAGCVSASQKANTLSEQNAYKSVDYANAGQQGPSVIVLPCQITTTSYEFLQRVSPDALHDVVETEMSKANFKVIETQSNKEMYQEIAVAANLGDNTQLKKFVHTTPNLPQWLVGVDIVEVKNRTTAFKFTDKQMAAMAGALMGSMLLGKTGAQIGASALGSISSAEERREWDLTLRYRIFDTATGEVLHQGQFTDQASIFKEIKGFMGFDTKEASGVTLSTTAQKLVQTAVADIDGQPKLTALAAPPAPKSKVKAKAVQAQAKGKSKKSGKDDDVKTPQIVCTPFNFGGLACQVPAAWAAGQAPGLQQAAAASNPNVALLTGNSGAAAQAGSLAAIAQAQAAGPLATLNMPGSPLAASATAVALTGTNLDGRLFVLPGVAGKVNPDALFAQLEKHFQQSTMAEALGVETVEAKSGPRMIKVYKFITIEHQKVEATETTSDPEKGKSTKTISIPHYHNLAIAVVPKDNDMVLAIIVAPEDDFLGKLPEFRQLVGSVS